MNEALKLRIKIQNQQMTMWELVKQAENYVMFRASITSGKKKPDGTWDNINQTFTCFAGADLIKKINEGFTPKVKINVSGSLTILPEKRTAMGKNGEYQETIFSNPTINIDAIEFLEEGSSFSPPSSASKTDGTIIDDDIPF